MIQVIFVLILLVVHVCAVLHPGHPPLDVPRDTLGRMASIASHDVGIPASLTIAVMMTESDASNTAVSKSCARGPMQLLTSTAHDFGVTAIQDARQNVYGGVRYLAWLRAHYHGDLVKTVAAYNAGPGAVDKFEGVPPYAETRAYVSAVLSRALPLPSVAPVVVVAYHRHLHPKIAPHSLVAEK